MTGQGRIIPTGAANLPPICQACAEGDHGQALRAQERCNCPCHGGATAAYSFGPDRAPIMPDGTIRYYREILTADGRELIGLEREAGTTPAPTHVHRSSACVKAIGDRGRTWKPDPITAQFRFIVRMAVACHERGVPYTVAWDRHDSGMRATITATGAIPTPKPLPKPPKQRPMAVWKPAIWDAVYRLDAYHDQNRKRRCPGFVIEHSCGLSLVHPSESGELGVTEHGGDEDIRQNWLVTHSASGMGFGLTLNFKRATDALLMAASFPVDWTQGAETLKTSAECRRAGNTVLAAYGNSHEKDTAKRKLAELDRAELERAA